MMINQDCVGQLLAAGILVGKSNYLEYKKSFLNTEFSLLVQYASPKISVALDMLCSCEL